MQMSRKNRKEAGEVLRDEDFDDKVLEDEEEEQE